MADIIGRIGMRALGLAIATAEAAIRRFSRDGRRAYFDTADFAWAARLEEHWREIRGELDAVLAGREPIPPFHVVSEEQRSITDDDRWRVFVFRVFGTPVERNCRRCPRTAALLAEIPGLRNAMFSILAPRKVIPEHRGIYCGLLRYHLALKVPADGASCRLWVAGEARGWEEGRTLIFDDAYPHSVRNDTGEERVVLFADFERPLPGPLAPANRAFLALLARLPLFREPLAKFERGEL